jgi:hypothetical protein
MYLRGVTVVTGDASLPEDAARENIVTVGKCIREDNRTERHIDGCPPNNVLVVRAIIGDRAEVKRIYADGSLGESRK